MRCVCMNICSYIRANASCACYTLVHVCVYVYCIYVNIDIVENQEDERGSQKYIKLPCACQPACR